MASRFWGNDCPLTFLGIVCPSSTFTTASAGIKPEMRLWSSLYTGLANLPLVRAITSEADTEPVEAEASYRYCLILSGYWVASAFGALPLENISEIRCKPAARLRFRRAISSPIFLRSASVIRYSPPSVPYWLTA